MEGAGGEKGTADAMVLLRKLHSDTLEAEAPHLFVKGTVLTQKLLEARKLNPGEGWQNGHNDNEAIRFLRRLEERQGGVVEAERDTLVGNPREFLENLKRFQDTGELPDATWEEGVKQRAPMQRTRQVPAWQEDLEREDEASREAFEALKRQQAEHQPKCEDEKNQLEKDFPFIKIDLGADNLEQKSVLWHLEYDLKISLLKLSVEEKKELEGTTVAFVAEKEFIFSNIYKKPEMQITIPGYFCVVIDHDGINRAAKQLHDIRTRHKDDTAPIRTEDASFWINDLKSLLSKKYLIGVNVGKAGELEKSKIDNLYELVDLLESLDPKYRDALRGTQINFIGKDSRYDNVVELRVVYPWGGSEEWDIEGIRRRVKDVVDSRTKR